MKQNRKRPADPPRHTPKAKPGTALHPIRRPGKTLRDKERKREATDGPR